MLHSLQKCLRKRRGVNYNLTAGNEGKKSKDAEYHGHNIIIQKFTITKASVHVSNVYVDVTVPFDR